MELKWKARSKGHRLFADGRDTFIKVDFKPRFKHYGVYQALTHYRDYKGELCPSFSKVTFGLTLEEAKASAAAIYLLTKE